jgi:hypothetical protein
MRERTEGPDPAKPGDENFSAPRAVTESEAAAAAFGAEAEPGGTPAIAPQIAGSQDLEFVLSVDVIYHRSRQAFLAGAHRWMMFGVIVSGASAASTFAPAFFGLISAALGAADIAFDFVGRAQAHGDAARRYLALISRFADGAETADIRKVWLEISAEEPATYRHAGRIAHNETCDALRRGDKVTVTFWQRLRANLTRN